MLLVVDIGNTSVKLGLMEKREGQWCPVRVEKLPTDGQWVMDEYARAIRVALGTAQVQAIAISSVVPAVQAVVIKALEGIYAISPLVIDRSSDLGLILDVDAPEGVGRDRLVDSAWAAASFDLPAVTVDLGTATTFNVIDRGGIFRGGIIAPGLSTGLKALANLTAQLPDLTPEAPKALIGRDTKGCMLSGAVAGTAAMIDGLVLDIEEVLKSPVTLVITGGGGEYIRPFLRHAHFYEPEMMLRGLAMLYENNYEPID